MTARRTAALLGLALLLTSCSTPGGAGTGDVAARTSASAQEQSPSPSRTPEPSPSNASPTAPQPARSLTEAGWGPSTKQLRRAERIVGRLPLARLAGQVIVAEYTGKQPPTSLVNRLHLGGVIVMSGNVGTTSQLRRSNEELQVAAKEAGRRWPVFIGVDQEGGIVERVKGRATRFPAFMSAGAARDTALTRNAAAASGAELRDLGFSVVFAPDADVTSGPNDPTIGSRSAGSRPKVVARQMNAAVDGYLSSGILPVIKHFPGHGSVSADSHTALPVQTKTLRRLRASDLVPFETGVAEGVPAVMAAHIAVRAVDPGVPSTVSRRVVTGLLRRDLGFRGLVVTDAMNMAAVADRHSSGEGAVRALQAGNDVVLMPPSASGARDGIVQAVRSGRLSRARLEQAAARQIAALLHQRELEPALTRKPGTSGRASYRLSAGAATVASGPCRGRLVGKAVRAVGPSDAVDRFNAAARKAGLVTGSGTSVALIGYGGSGRSADVVVTMDTPYALRSSRARVAKIAMYGDTPGAMRALVRVLQGKARATGRLPVPVRGVQRSGC
ncbi:MAG TPA: glycoside hydrolase family 3 N-terminal domain-containing protein [Nocardioidaceae bacterium]|nr:glycoside hydrolase family 3 N-terminal domain-containing protein [Nocardioidaceae bacterium]